jgi:type IV pilus assembly protein PilV
MSTVSFATRQRRARAAQGGSFLLEALIAILIIALAVLGLVGLLARSMQNVDDAKFRGEAAYLANSYIGQMWVDNKATLGANFDDTSGGANYAAFSALVAQRLPNTDPPVVTVAPGPTPQSSVIEITVTWQPPGDKEKHSHFASATIAGNK